MLENMEVKVLENAMRFVFRYLSSVDLLNMSSISRSWSEVIKKENLLKCPQVIPGQIIETANNKISIKDNVLHFNHNKPQLLLLFTTKKWDSIIVEKLHAQLDPSYCYTILLRRGLCQDEKTFWTILIPRSSTIQLKACTFSKRVFGPGFRCLESCHFMEIDLVEYMMMESYYKKFIYGDYCVNTCMILLCLFYNLPTLASMVLQLKDWFNFGPIWGATIESAEVCNSMWNEPPYSSDGNIIQIFINGQNMIAKYLLLDSECHTKEKIQQKFQDLKNKISLKKNSIAFLCTSVMRYHDFYEIESATFKEVFPNVKLAHIFSARPLGAENLEELEKYFKNICPNSCNDYSTFLLISYDD